MRKIQYSIAISDKESVLRVHPLKEGETTIGSDLGSDICVPGVPGLLERHILVAPRPEHCWVSTASGAPLHDERGQAVVAGFVPWGTRLCLGRTFFDLQVPQRTVLAEETANRGNAGGGGADTGRESGAGPRGVHPILVMLLLSTISFLVLDLFSASEAPGVYLPAEQLDLFAEAAACDSANPAHRADQAEHAALAKSERSVFHVQDGIAAVALFEEAAACYARAGAISQATRNSDLAQDLRDSLTYDYRRLRLRLERAMALGQVQVASEQVRRLQELLHHQPESPTSLGLRRLALRLSRKN